MAHLAVGKRKGNPNWGKFGYNSPLGVTVTAFEKKIAECGIDPDDTDKIKRSQQLKRWAEQHRNHRYIPEPLLAAWGITVNLSDLSVTKWNL